LVAAACLAAAAGARAQDPNRLIQPTRQLRVKLLEDPHRPGYHFVTPEGLCGPFDPNGALFWKDRYHLMYIFQNEKGHCWGHVSSKDLLHWRQHPPALEPGEGDAGIFSGGASLDKDGVPTITYWGLGGPRGICLATSTDELLETWTKSPHNPVIRETAHGLTVATRDGGQVVYGAADPTAIWVRGGRHYLLTGNLLVLREFGQKRKMPEHLGDTAYLFVSDDLAQWEYLHPFYTSDRKWTRADEDNMCPDFFPLPSTAEGGPPGDRHMLLFISHNLGCQYYLGRYADDRFEPLTHGRMTWVDNAFFAPESLVDGRGRRIMWAWIFDGRSGSARQASGWSGTMSLPRVLWLGEDRTLRMRPAEELARLRYNGRKRTGLSVEADGELILEGVRGNSIELAVEMVPDGAGQFGVKVCRSAAGEEETLVYYDAAEKKLAIDTRRSSLGEGPKSVEAGPLELKPGEPLTLRVFVDKSVVEVFANDRQAVMRRIYPTREDSVGVALFSRGGSVEVPSVEAWEMMPSNPY
jgi:beta-fructofuranosidase